MNKRYWALLACMALLGHPTAAGARESPGDARVAFDLFIGGDLRLFNYREFSESGRELNHEYGPLPGLRLTGDGTWGRGFARADVTAHAGEVVYDGETQGGRPVTSETETGLAHASIQLGGWVGTKREHWGGYLHYARRVWNRDIQSTDAAQGIFERYQWSEAGLGVRHHWPGRGWGGWHHAVSGTAFAVVDGTIFVDLSGLERSGARWDDETLRLGDAGGLRLRYTATRPIGSGYRLRISPYLAAWAFGRSNAEQITSDGEPADCDPDKSGTQECFVVEPRSESQRIGVAVGFVF